MALYVGILTDTGSFRYVNTNSFTHQVVAELLKFNLDVYKIYRNIYENISFSDASLLIKVFLGLERVASGKILIFKIKQRLLKNKSVYFDLSEHILNFGQRLFVYQKLVMYPF